jgi:hypothetical protein
MADVRQRGGDERQLFSKLRPRHQFVLRHRSADLDRADEIADNIERGEARDVDQHADVDQPQIEHRHQRLPAGQHARVVAIFGEQRNRLLGRIGPRVIERARFHVLSPFSACGGCSMAWMRRGVAGNITSSTPSASAMALAMQAGVDMQLPSAMPLAPSGVSGDGDS